MKKFEPFENEEQSWSIGSGDGLTIQNGLDEVSIFGEAKFEHDEDGLASAAELLAILSEVSAKLLDSSSTEKCLWTKRRGGSLVVGGDVDLIKGKPCKSALAEAISALSDFGMERKAREKGPAA